jgi:hypothetical protein
MRERWAGKIFFEAYQHLELVWFPSTSVNRWSGLPEGLRRSPPGAKARFLNRLVRRA